MANAVTEFETVSVLRILSSVEIEFSTEDGRSVALKELIII